MTLTQVISKMKASRSRVLVRFKIEAVFTTHMDEAAFIAASTMAVVIVVTSSTVKLLHSLLTRHLRKSTQAWRVC
jgi:hypothetical protein